MNDLCESLVGIEVRNPPPLRTCINAGCDFDCYNAEFVQSAHTVGCAYLPNNRKVDVLKKSGGSESMHSENTAITPLTTATHVAETCMNRGFAGGGGI